MEKKMYTETLEKVRNDYAVRNIDKLEAAIKAGDMEKALELHKLNVEKKTGFHHFAVRWVIRHYATSRNGHRMKRSLNVWKTMHYGAIRHVCRTGWRNIKRVRLHIKIFQWKIFWRTVQYYGLLFMITAIRFGKRMRKRLPLHFRVATAAAGW